MKNLLRVTVLIFVCSGCVRATLPVREFRNQESAGTLHVAVQSIAPFDEDYINQLQPTIALTDEAAANAIAQTRLSELQRLRAMLIEGGLMLPDQTTSRTTTLKPDGTVQSTSDEKVTPPTQTGIPAAPTAITGNLTPFTLPADPIRTDLSLTFRSVLALRQEVALLNRQVRDAAVSRGTKPYVVRFLVTLNPLARREPYNAYATISLFSESPETEVPWYLESGDIGKELRKVLTERSQSYCGRPIEIIPLFVTDNLESSLESIALQASNNVGVASGGIVNNIAARLTGRFQDEERRRAQARTFNSLFTIARVSGNTVEARLGALTSGTDFEMVPRTYNVTVLALAPTLLSALESTHRSGSIYEDARQVGISASTLREAAAESEVCRTIAFTSRYRFTDGRSGRTLGSAFVPMSDRALDELRTRWQLHGTSLDDLRQLLVLAEYDHFEEFVERVKWPQTSGDKRIQEALLRPDLRDSVYRAAPANATPPPRTEVVRLLWTELVEIARRSDRSYGRVGIPNLPFYLFHDREPGTVVDDGKTATITLAGAQNLSSAALDAQMRVSKDGKNHHTINASKVTVSRDGRRATFEFDSPKRLLKTAPSCVQVTVSRPASSRFFESQIAHRWTGTTDDGRLTYLDAAPVETPKPKLPATMEVTAPHIVLTGEDGSGRLAIAFSPVDPKVTPTVRFDVVGGYIAETEPRTDESGGDRIAAGNRTYILTVRNLAPRGKLTVRSFVDKNGARGDAIQEKVIDVIDAPPKAKEPTTTVNQ